MPKKLGPKPADPAKMAQALFERPVSQAPFEPPPGAINIRTQSIVEMEREKRVLEAALFEEERALGRESFWYFITEIMYPEVWRNHYTLDFHKPIVDELQNLEQGQDIWLFLQREARKTYISNILHNIWLIIRDPNIRLLLVGAREETVKPFARLIMSAFRLGTPGFEKFQKLYPEFIVDGRGTTLRQAYQFTVPNRTATLADPTFRAAYLGVTGAGWRCDVLNFDDPIERRNVFTPEGSAKALGQMLDLLPLVDSTSAYQNIKGAGTRWAYHDPYGKLLGDSEESSDEAEAMEKFKSRKAKVIIRHAFEDLGRLCEHCPPHVTAQWPHGHPVSPETDENGVATCFPIHTRESLIDKLNKYRTNPTQGEALWFHQYQNVCMAPASQKFKSEWFDLVIDKPSWPVSKKAVIAIDSADKDFQKKGLGDWMVALMGDFDDYGRLCLRYGLRSNRWTRDEFLRHILAWCQGTNWWPRVVVKEKFGEDNFLTDVGNYFKNVFRPVHCHATTRPAYQGTLIKKFDWIVETLQGPMERGEVIFGNSFPRELRERAKYEGTSLGQTSHEDVIDTISLFFATGIRPTVPNRPVSGGIGVHMPNVPVYDPDNAPKDTIPGMVIDPLRTRGTEIMVSELGFSQTNWDQSKPSLFKIDEW